MTGQQDIAQSASTAQAGPVPVVVVGDDCTEAALRQAEDATMLVLGTRGHFHGPGALLGSGGRRCVRWAAIPVVRLGPDAVDQPEQRIVATCRSGWAAGAAHEEALALHAQALSDVRAAIGHRAHVSGALVEGRSGTVEYEGTRAGDLLVVGRDDEEHRPSIRYSHRPVVLVPPSSTARTLGHRRGHAEVG